jgi:hypothetical protein
LGRQMTSIADAIREHGLPGRLVLRDDAEGKSVHVSRDLRDAADWAQKTARQTGGRAVVLEVHLPPEITSADMSAGDIPPEWIKRVWVGGRVNADGTVSDE